MAIAQLVEQPGIGTGLYTYSEAARLLRVSTQKVSRWANGYTYKMYGLERKKRPILQRQMTEHGLLTFRDLIELFVVQQLRELGVKLEHIRNTSKRLAEEWNTPYPFASQNINTDGSQILTEADGCYENAETKQKVLDIVEDFFKNVEFDADDIASKWWPRGIDGNILVDPRYSFGSPVIKDKGIRTEVIYLTYKAEKGDVDSVADWYDITADEVKAAVAFEEEWQTAA